MAKLPDDRRLRPAPPPRPGADRRPTRPRLRRELLPHVLRRGARAPRSSAAFEISLILYAEHSFNASTFTARVVTSTLSDIYSAVTGGHRRPEGPAARRRQRGGDATMLEEIGDPAQADGLAARRAGHASAKIMGFGHRVYKHGDSRVPTMRAALGRLARLRDGQTLWSRSTTTSKQTMIAEKGIYPNLDFPTGPAYYLMGFDIADVHADLRHDPDHRLDRPRHRAAGQQLPHPPAQLLHRAWPSGPSRPAADRLSTKRRAWRPASGRQGAPPGGQRARHPGVEVGDVVLARDQHAAVA